jgi:molybdate transport system ATP-binding protein
MRDATTRDGRAGLSVRLQQQAPIPLDAEFDAEPGELVAIVGPSGSGKTTVLRCIAGLTQPRDGLIRCNGTIWLSSAARIALPPQRRSVGLVFQHYALFPHLTAAANVTAALGHVPRGERPARGRALLDLVHLAGLEERRPAELSGGQQQRVALARALAREPAVLLLDEPFSAVDQVTRRKLYRELAQLRQRLRIPILLVTHDLDEAAKLADRMVILHRGRTLQAGPPRDVMERPRSVEVARLVDLHNLFDGEIVEHRPAAGLTLLRWCGIVLEARHAPDFAPGARVRWLVPPGSVLLHRGDRPSRGEHENPVRGTVAELLVLGDTSSIALRVEDCDEIISFGVPNHVAERNGVARDAPIAVSLLAKDIHVMPWQSGAEPGPAER